MLYHVNSSYKAAPFGAFSQAKIQVTKVLLGTIYLKKQRYALKIDALFEDIKVETLFRKNGPIFFWKMC